VRLFQLVQQLALVVPRRQQGRELAGAQLELLGVLAAVIFDLADQAFLAQERDPRYLLFLHEAQEVAILDRGTAELLGEEQHAHHHEQDHQPDPAARHHGTGAAAGVAGIWWGRTRRHGQSSIALRTTAQCLGALRVQPSLSQ
jgi:hypothetical protein